MTMATGKRYRRPVCLAADGVRIADAGRLFAVVAWSPKVARFVLARLSGRQGGVLRSSMPRGIWMPAGASGSMPENAWGVAEAFIGSSPLSVWHQPPQAADTDST